MRTINFVKNLRLSQIQQIKTAEFKFKQFGKKEGKTLHSVNKIALKFKSILNLEA
jgi:hypothetical protein